MTRWTRRTGIRTTTRRRPQRGEVLLKSCVCTPQVSRTCQLTSSGGIIERQRVIGAMSRRPSVSSRWNRISFGPLTLSQRNDPTLTPRSVTGRLSADGQSVNEGLLIQVAEGGNLVAEPVAVSAIEAHQPSASSAGSSPSQRPSNGVPRVDSPRPKLVVEPSAGISRIIEEAISSNKGGSSIKSAKSAKSAASMRSPANANVPMPAHPTDSLRPDQIPGRSDSSSSGLQLKREPSQSSAKESSHDTDEGDKNAEAEANERTSLLGHQGSSGASQNGNKSRQNSTSEQGGAQSAQAKNKKHRRGKGNKKKGDK